MIDGPALLLLGEPRVRTFADHEPRERTLPGSTGTTVLALLAVHLGHVVTLDQLLEQVWPEVSPDSARNRVHVQVSRLRRRLQGTGLEVASRHVGYAMVGKPEAVDLHVFRQLVESAEREAADAAWTAVLRSTTLADSVWRGDPFVHMTAPSLDLERSELFERRRSMLKLRCHALLELRRPDEALVPARELQRMDPYGESGVSASMRALTEAGRRADALDVYDQYRRALAEELGLDPGRELVELQGQVLRGHPYLAADRAVDSHGTRPGAAPSTGDPEQSTDASSPADPVVGRRVELASIESLVAQVGRGGPGVLLLEGEAGIGRSTLARHATAVATSRGVRAIRAQAPDSGLPPSLALWHQVGSRLGIEIPTGAVTDVRAAFTTVEATVRAVLAAVRDRPTLLVLDDVQRTDDASVQVLQRLAGELWDEPLAILATRQFHGVPSTPVKELAWTRLSQEPVATVIELRPLDVAEVAAVAGASEREAHALHRRTGGNPRLLHELLRGSPRPSPDETLPCGIRSLIRSLLLTVPPVTRSLVTAAAVAGPSFDPRVLGRAFRLEERAVAFALCPAVEAGIVKPAHDDVRWSFRHELEREGVLDLVASPRRRELEERLSAALTEEAVR